jgi:zinc dependent phospholipase C
MSSSRLPQRAYRRGLSSLLVAIFFFCATSQICSGYSVLTHEEIVDLLWAEQIKPLLLKKYPGTTEDELVKAHAYAYGGCLVQDMGYYPFGNRFFSDLVHYVRSGDFVLALLDEAQDVNEYAFALGALAHYASDLTGHPVVNAAVPIEFPKLRKKFGNSVTFAQDPKAHVRTEFGFDVVQVAKQRYSPDSYRDFIGFEVAKPVLERAFVKTYGVDLKDVFRSLDLSIGSFRRSVSKIVPEMTRVALATRKADMVKEDPSFTKRKFLYNLKRAEYERTWGKEYQKPGFGARFMALIFRLIPKVGPFKAIAFKVPSGDIETKYLKSVNDTVDQYRAYLRQLANHDIHLANKDFDTGKETQAGEYPLTDSAYAKLLDKLAGGNFAQVTPQLRQNVLAFYNGAPASTNKDEWEKAMKNLEQLKATGAQQSAFSHQR